MHVPIQDYSNHVSLCTVSKAVAELAAHAFPSMHSMTGLPFSLLAPG